MKPKTTPTPKAPAESAVADSVQRRVRQLVLDWRSTAIAYEVQLRRKDISKETASHHRAVAVQLRACAIELETKLSNAKGQR